MKDLIIFLCISRFNIKEQKAEILKEFFSQNEIKTTKKKKDGKLDLVEVLLISNTEEDDHKDLIELVPDTNEQNRESKLSLLQTTT
ncbi:unnamed protein product [Penicillium salamii]|nr:unnamed protein product [Penicillium salamii]CAG8081406.1 unnamed protein product [Penicillium salamii]CAG8374949.1 unnamed protein product [Penicillium salamii]